MSDELLTVSQVCRRVPGARGAKTVCPSTVTRWILQGCPALDGTRVKLNATRAGARWLVAPADLEAFFAALKGEATAPAPVPAPAARDQSRRARAAIKTLIAQGA